MKGSETKILGFMEGADKRYVIPVYQRKYNWKYENCRQLYDDLKKIVNDGRKTHFFGSIVSSVVPNGSTIEYHIIDGQQRLTTITLLLLAMRNLIKNGVVDVEDNKLDEQISERFLISPWASQDDQIKLRLVRTDREALKKLFGDENDFECNSNLTVNYQFFYEILQKNEVSIYDLYTAIAKLEIICITLGEDDNAQLIFESLNSTGLALTEGDKIRNYVLMGLSPEKQQTYYNSYWTKIESCTKNDVSSFIRDYLSIKQAIAPTLNNVYVSFKSYAEEVSLSINDLLYDLLRYARFYKKLLTCKSDLGEKRIDDCLYRFMRLEIVVIRPFLMEVLRLHDDKKITIDDVLKVLLITENYLFRRNICDVPTNALNKIFLNLNKEIIRYDNTADNYVNKFIYALLSKKESGRFPTVNEFRTALSEKQIYQMRGKYKAYLFERLENHGTIETKDVYVHLDNKTYTIEHIMPQHLSPEWNEALGKDAAEIHSVWLHRLANLTLTGYNPSLSNKSFVDKRDCKIVRYKDSGIRMNQLLSKYKKWGVAELKSRNEYLLDLAMQIWEYPTTDFEPSKTEFDSCSLDDESFEFTGRDIVKYSYQNIDQPVTSWIDMFEHIVRYLHQKNPKILMSIIFDNTISSDLSKYISNKESNLRSSLQIDDNLYIEKNTNTTQKMSILRRLFALYKVDPMDLIFYLKNPEKKKAYESGRHEIRTRYWGYALPIIQERYSYRGTFSGCKISTSNTISGYFGKKGICISCIANYDNARVDFYLGSSDIKLNKNIFNNLYRNKFEIEEKLGITLEWYKAENNKASWISYILDGVSITNESDWEQMANFHAKWSDKISSTLLEYILSDEEKRLNSISIIFREWVMGKKGVYLDLEQCNRTYTRFMTDTMSEILPDINNGLSSWNTSNHYFYEIINRDGQTTYIQLAINSKNITSDYRAICDNINIYYPAKRIKDNWVWRIPFKTKTIKIDDNLDKDVIKKNLDSCLMEIYEFEKDLKNKLNI